ncbi:MAG: lipocalin family protein [Bacteroidota bacterium]|nr:lipocalin family protein [Bacteroidota bacterium]
MKKLLLALAVLGTVSFATTSCNKNDDSNDVDGSIVGTWEAQDANVVVKQNGKEKTIQEFFQALGIPADEMGDMVEDEVPGRIEFTSDGKLVAYEQDDSGKWVKIGEGTYSLKGDQLKMNLRIQDEDGVEEQSITATVKTLNSSKAEIRIDMTAMMQELFAALAAEDPEEAEAILALFKGCSFYADITLKRV